MSDDLISWSRTFKIYGYTLEQVKEKISTITFGDVEYKLEPYDLETQIILNASAEYEDDARKLIKPVAKEIKKIFGDAIYSTKQAETIEMALVRLLDKNDLVLTTAESLTGGLLAARIVNVPGASEIFREGFITYSNKAKRKALDVSKNTLKKYGAVSKQTAKEMATGAVFAGDADCSLAVTGIAGPDGGTEKKPVGLVYIACYLNDKVTVEEYHFEGDRNKVRELSVNNALDLLRRMILERD